MSKCPRCNNIYTERPALSRTDNKTLICPMCGVKEALENSGVPLESQEEIVKSIQALEISKS